MPDDPDTLIQAVVHAEDAFGGQFGQPDYEDGLNPTVHDADIILG